MVQSNNELRGGLVHGPERKGEDGMKQFLGLLSGSILGLGALTAEAGGINPADFGFVLPGTLIEGTNGIVEFDPDLDFIAAGVGLLEFETFVSDPDDAFFDFDLGTISHDDATSTITSSIMAEVMEFFFDAGSEGYLVTIDVTGQGLDFTDTDPFNIFSTDAEVSLVEFGKPAAVVPLPAGLPLMLAGLGAFAVVSRRRQS